MTDSTSDLSAQLTHAMALQRSGLLDRAEVIYREMLGVDAQHFDATHLLGVIALQRGDAAAAVELIQRAIAIRPNVIVANRNLAAGFAALGQHAQALQACDRALALSPNDIDAMFSRATALQNLAKHDEALAAFDDVLTRQPGHALARIGRGILHQAAGRLDQALVDFDAAVNFAPAQPLAHYNRGNALKALNRVVEAEASVRQALMLAPHFAEAHVLLAECLFLQNKSEVAWPEYEWRWQTQAFRAAAKPQDSPIWNGRDDLRGKTILLHAEQGLGDAVQFLRYVAPLKARGAQVVLDVPGPLAALATPLATVDSSSSFDFHIALMSLPQHLGLISSPAPYLHADAAKIAAWKTRLGPRARPRIGVVWSGSRTHANDAKRSIRFRDFQNLMNVSADFISLQKDIRDEDGVALAQNRTVRQLESELHDLSDTAALIANLDLVISVDTVVAHVAGALAKPVWILLPFAPDWRWGLGQNTTPWYPSATLYRQPVAGDWRSVLARVADDVKALT
jgi:tetratricopeptide (TPR) repeat protein